MVLYWPNATKIVNRLNFMCLLVYLWSNRKLKKNANIVFCLKVVCFSYFLMFEPKKAYYTLA